MRIITGIIVLLAFPNVVLCQGDNLSPKRTVNSIGIYFGFMHTRLVDEGFTQSKFLFRGTNDKLRLRYERRSENAIFGFATSISNGEIRTRQKEWPASYFNFALASEYLRNTQVKKIAGRQYSLFAGLRFSTINHLIQNEPIFDNVDIISLHGIYVKLNLEAMLDKKQHLTFTYALPAVVYVNQVLWNSGASIYDFDDLENIGRLLTAHGQFTYIDIFRNIPIEVLYRRKLGRVVDFNFRYAFAYVKSDVDQPIRIYSNEILLGVAFNF